MNFYEDYNRPDLGEAMPTEFDYFSECWRVVDAERAEVKHYDDFDTALKEYNNLKYNRNSAVEYLYKGAWIDAFEEYK